MVRVRTVSMCLLITLLVQAAVVAAQDGDAYGPVTVAALVSRGDALRREGRYRAAFEDLRSAVSIAQDPAARRYALAGLGVAEAEAGLDDADQTLRLALRDASAPWDDAAVVVGSLLARRLAARGELVEASELAASASRFAASGAMRVVAATSQMFVAGMEDDIESARRHLSAALAELQALGDVAQPLLVTTATVAASVEAAALSSLARAALSNAPPGSTAISRAEFHEVRAWLAQQEGDLADARREAEAALSSAQAAGREDIAFRVNRRRIDIATELGDKVEALAAARSAFGNLLAVRRNFVDRFDAAGRSLYRLSTDGFHAQLIDLILRRHDLLGTPDLLDEARRVIDDLRVFEVEDYFRERCIPRDGAIDLAAVGADTAIVFPILLEDRLELIVSIDGALLRRTSPAPATLVGLLVDGALAGTSAGLSHRRVSKRLYDAFLGPIEDLLTDVGTIVVVPDGPLRAFPPGALWTGEHYLIESHDVAVILGLDLFTPATPGKKLGRMLVAATTQTAVPGFVPIPGVAEEARSISRFGAADLLLNEEFVVRAATQQLSRPAHDIAHIAAHATFGVGPEDNFIAAADGRLVLGDLVNALRARSIESSERLELLTLSACETARGTDRAPLGLAGAAFRAQVPSVVASLWLVADDAAAALMKDFYEKLLVEGAGRAAALGGAQRAMLARGGAFAHPAAWGPFVLLGDWR